MMNLDKMLTDATCYESELRFSTNQRSTFRINQATDFVLKEINPEIA
ncbi:hypothetical protein RB619_20795 [Flavobacterium sp. LHD-80]|nr:hypothetical protein [Flavobacterium sp. LHD-80]MDQ6473086.1 hypothetical protein [Flavobacterium sp. LHD-80]